jgi:hypothetical protein
VIVVSVGGDTSRSYNCRKVRIKSSNTGNNAFLPKGYRKEHKEAQGTQSSKPPQFLRFSDSPLYSKKSGNCSKAVGQPVKPVKTSAGDKKPLYQLCGNTPQNAGNGQAGKVIQFTARGGIRFTYWIVKKDNQQGKTGKMYCFIEENYL